MTEDTKIDEVVAEVLKRIGKGIYNAGQRLPSERELTNEFGVSRATIREALQRLQTENAIDIVPRGGAFIHSPNTKVILGPAEPSSDKAPVLELKRSGSFVRAMEEQGRPAIVRFIEPSSILEIGVELGSKMETAPETKVLRRYRLHIVGKVPYRILDSYYLADLLGDLLGKDEGYIPLFKWLRDNKSLKASRVFEKINVRPPSGEEARLLNIPRSQWVIDMDRWVWADNNKLFEYSHIIENAALHEHTYEYTIDEEASR